MFATLRLMPHDTSRALADIVRLPLTTVDVHDTVGRVLEVSQREDVHHFPVQQDDQLVGFLCVCDLIGASEETPVELVMTPEIAALQESDSVLDAAKLMKDTGFGSILVVKDQVAKGIVTRADVVAWNCTADFLLNSERCDCCGLTHHLRKLKGRTLCVYCQDSTTEEDWLSAQHP